MSLNNFWLSNKTEIIISAGFALISIALLIILGFANKNNEKDSKKFFIGSTFLLFILVGLNYLMIKNIDVPTVIKFSESFILKISPIDRLIVINVVLLSAYSFLLFQLYKAKRKTSVTTTNVAIMGVLIGVSSVLMLFSIPIFPPAPFLKLEVSGLIIFMVFIWFDAKTAIIVSILTNLIHVFMPSTSAPLILFLDEFVNFVATMSFLVPSLLYIKKDENGRVINGNKIYLLVPLGVLFTTIFMVLYNFLFNLPMVYGMQWEFSAVLFVFGLFNLIKWGSVGFLVSLLWKRLEPLMTIRRN